MPQKRAAEGGVLEEGKEKGVLQVCWHVEEKGYGR
jgi:hypothetical protein